MGAQGKGNTIGRDSKHSRTFEKIHDNLHSFLIHKKRKSNEVTR